MKQNGWKESGWYKAVFTDKGILHKKIFTIGSEKANHRVAMFFLPLVIVLLILGFWQLAYGSVQAIYQQYRCEKRHMTWYSTPPVFASRTSIRNESFIRLQIEPLVSGKYANWYKEKYIYGYCVSESAPSGMVFLK